MSETLKQELGTAEWQNVTSERIGDPVKAEHMAKAEEAWREKAKDLGGMALDMYDNRKAFPEGSYQNDEAESVRDGYLRGADKVMTELGPEAVQAVADAYDTLQKPPMPSQERNFVG